MYQNMTREEMIQRLYEGNFTTGELERQLIAKLFEQCCGGGSGSSGGGVLIVHENYDEATNVTTLDKTAAEIYEAAKNGMAILASQAEEGENGELESSWLCSAGRYNGAYEFTADGGNKLPTHYYAASDDDYPTDQKPGGGEPPMD